MNLLRHNAVTIFLTITVLALTGLNQFTTQARLAEFQSNNADLAIVVAERESARLERAEKAFGQLRDHFVKLRQAYQEARLESYALQQLLAVAGEHIAECHRLLEANNIQPPSFNEHVGGPEADDNAPQPPRPCPTPAQPQLPPIKADKTT